MPRARWRAIVAVLVVLAVAAAAVWLLMPGGEQPQPWGLLPLSE